MVVNFHSSLVSFRLFELDFPRMLGVLCAINKCIELSGVPNAKEPVAR